MKVGGGAPVFVTAEKTYRVRRSDSNERAYHLYELTWLWRTGELPHDAAFLSDDGQWRPINELVEPVLQAQDEKAKAPGPPPRSRLAIKWVWAAGLCGALVLAVVSSPELYRHYAAWKSDRQQAREALEREQSARKQDFISSNLVIPGMTPEEVRRTVGPPRSINATGDGNLQRWIYRSQVIVFDSGKVIGVEATK